MSWLARLASELTERRQYEVTEADLRAQLQLFIAKCDDTYLRDSYPKDVNRLGGRPHARTVDLVLSFMNELESESPPIVKEMAQGLVADSPQPVYELAKVLAKERKRRWLNPRSTKQRNQDAAAPRPARAKDQTYWGRNHRRVVEKYAGLYALIRHASDLSLRIEPFAIVPQTDDPTTVSAFWQCRDKLRVGDLLVNTYRFSGLTLTRSTDKVIEPASIAFLRAPRTLGEQAPEREKSLLVMGGFIVGWKDKDPHRLIQSRFALIKLGVPRASVDTEEKFSATRDTDAVTSQLRRLAHHPSVTGALVERFLSSSSPEIGRLDARNALPGLDAD